MVISNAVPDMIHNGAMKLVSSGFSTDGDAGASIDLTDFFKGHILPDRFVSVVTSTSGTVVAIDLSLQGSIDDTNWEDLTAVVLKSVYYHYTVDYTSAVGVPKKVFRYVRHIGVDIASHTLSIESLISVS